MLSPDDPAIRPQVVEVQRVAAALGLGPVPVEVAGGDCERAFTTLAAERVQALFVAGSTYFVRDRNEIIERGLLQDSGDLRVA